MKGLTAGVHEYFNILDSSHIAFCQALISPPATSNGGEEDRGSKGNIKWGVRLKGGENMDKRRELNRRSYFQGRGKKWEKERAKVPVLPRLSLTKRLLR